MENFIYIKKVSASKMITGYTLCAIGFILFLFNVITHGEELIFIWVLVFTIGMYTISTEGVEINFKENKFRQVVSVFEINFGIWTSYPKIEYISLIEQNVKQTIPGRPFHPSPDSYSLGKMTLINLFDENNRHKMLYATKDKDVAIEIAKKIQSMYNVDIKNHLE